MGLFEGVMAEVDIWADKPRFRGPASVGEVLADEEMGWQAICKLEGLAVAVSGTKANPISILI